MNSKLLAAFFDALVTEIGGVDAAAAVMQARKGAFSKGTISKMTSGQMAVSCEALIALEDAAQLFPFTQHAFDRIGHRTAATGDLKQLAARKTAAGADAISALFQAYSVNSVDPTRLTAEEGADLMAKLRAARQIAKLMIEAVEAEMSGGSDAPE